MTRAACRTIESPPARAAGFTLIELLVVIGILGLLVALTVVGFRVVGGASKSRVTATALENAVSLLSGYKLTSQPEDLFDTATMNALTSNNYNTPFRWRINPNGLANTILSAQAVTPNTLPGTGAVQPNLAERAVSERYLRDETARLIRRLMSVPENRKSIEAISPDRLAKVRFPTDPTVVPAPLTPGADPDYSPTAAGIVEGVVLLDGSGKPIYFIPGGGLANVNVGYLGTGDKADKLNYTRQVTVRAGDHAPFWASPGPDGDLTTGDDNVYSTQVDTK